MECIVRNIEILQDSRHTGTCLYHIVHPLTVLYLYFPTYHDFFLELFKNYSTVIIIIIIIIINHEGVFSHCL